MPGTNGYQLVGRNGNKRHYGFIKWTSKGDEVSKITLIVSNRKKNGHIRKRFENVWIDIIKAINKEFVIEDLNSKSTKGRMKYKKGVFK